MLIWKKGSVIAASSSNFFRRTQHLQPAAAFSSLLSGLQQTIRRLIAQRFSKRFWPAAALQQAHNNALFRSGFFAPAHQPHPLACSGMQALGVMQPLCGFRSHPHGVRAGGISPLSQICFARALGICVLAARVFLIHGLASSYRRRAMHRFWLIF